jgi:predicted dehydrogenase
VTVGIGIVGSGFMARTYAQCVVAHTSGTRLAAIAGGSRAADLARDYGVPAEPTLEALLANPDVDAVILATPRSTHLGQTLAAAAAGKHVYVEKPMALTAAECDQMIAACAAAGVVLTVNKVTRFRGSPRAAKLALDEGRIGQLRMIRAQTSVVDYVANKGWTADPAEGGLLLDMGAHIADAFRWYAGAEVRSVHALLRDFEPGPPLSRSAMVQFEMANDMIGQYWMSFELPPPGVGSVAQFLLVGSTGILDCDNIGAVRVGTAAGWETLFVMPAYDLNGDFTNPVRLAAFAEQVQDFADAIRDQRPPAVTGADGRAAIAVIDAVRESAATGRAVAPQPSEAFAS